MISIGDGFSLPSTVFFTSDKDAEVWFYSLIKKEDYSQFTLTESPFLIKPIDVSSLGGRCQYEGTAKRDPFLAIGAIFASGGNNIYGKESNKRHCFTKQRRSKKSGLLSLTREDIKKKAWFP